MKRALIGCHDLGVARAAPAGTPTIIYMSIFDDVLAFIRAPEPARFDPLALAVFRYQAANVPAYGAYVKSRGVDPDAVSAVAEIPPISTLAFKYASMESTAEIAAPDLRLFRTSGTTIGQDERGRHLVLRPEIYRASAVMHLRRMLFADNLCCDLLALHPTADRMPESSLAQMITWAGEEFAHETRCVATPAGVDIESAIGFLRDCIQRKRPVAILSTTASCARLFESLVASQKLLKLPKGSRLMDTGGAKGQVVPLRADEVVELAGRWLGIAPELVINEYGMTEMCSQLYDATAFNSSRSDAVASRWKLAPPWLRPVAIDPILLQPLPSKQPGLLAFFDLANVASVSMLLTEDVGIVDGGAVRILGRADGAEARGCALGIAEFATTHDNRS